MTSASSRWCPGARPRPSPTGPIRPAPRAMFAGPREGPGGRRGATPRTTRCRLGSKPSRPLLRPGIDDLLEEGTQPVGQRLVLDQQGGQEVRGAAVPVLVAAVRQVLAQLADQGLV